MSSIIEAAARTAKTNLAGGKDSQATATAQNQRGAELVRNMATGGLALGAGAGSLVALLNYLKSLQQENELEDESRLNDDTLYISAPRRKQANQDRPEVNRWLAPGLALTGGILSAGGSYALTQAVYNYLQRKRRQKLLDEAQGEALLAADMEVDKKASSEARMNLYDMITAVPVALPLLAALAAGGVSYAALKKTFPTVQKPKSRHPKRIRQVAADGTVKPPAEDDDTVKSAADRRAERDLEDAGIEFLLLTVDQASMEKRASFCLTSELLHKVAQDGLASVETTQKDGGMEALVELIKDADLDQVGLPEKVLAAAAICKSARLRPVAAAWAAGELHELAPQLGAEVFSHGEDRLEKFAGLAPLLHLSFFRPQMLEKSALTSALMEELQSLLASQPAIPDDIHEDLTSDAGGGMAEEAEGEDFEGAEGEIQSEDTDVVDQFMSGQQGESPILNPGFDHDTQTSAKAAPAPL